MARRHRHRHRHRRRQPVQQVTHYPYYGYGYPYYDPYRYDAYRYQEPRYVVVDGSRGAGSGMSIEGKQLRLSLHWPTILATLMASYALWGRR